MFEELAAAVDGLSIPVDGAALVEVLAVSDRLAAKVSAAVAAFDAAELWDLDAATSMTAWLRDRGDRARRDAARLASRSRRLARLPVTSAAWVEGRLSEGQVDSILAALTSATAGLFADHEAGVVPALAGLSAADTAVAMGRWQAHAAAVVDEGESAEPERAVHLSPVGDRWRLDGSLDQEGGQVVATALRLAAVPDEEGEPRRTAAERRADALVEVARFFLDHQTHRPGGRHRPHLNVVVDLDALDAGQGGSFADSAPIDGVAVQVLLCDSALHRVLRAGRSAIVDYGTATRTIPATLWNVVVLRDRHCRFPGCDRPSRWCDGHHVIPVSEDGPTRLDNLVLACRRHHRRLHQPGWHAKLLPDGTLHVTDPGGRHRTTRPPGPSP